MSQCNRPDRDKVYSVGDSGQHWQFSDYNAVWCSEWDGNTDMDNYCRSFNGNRKGFKSGNSGLISDEQLKDLNYVSAGYWGRDPSGESCDDYTSIGNCRMLEPIETNKYACCTDGKSNTLQCGLNWCSADVSNCTAYMGGYCAVGSRLIDDSNCYSKFSVSKASDISTLCAKPENFRKPNCKAFCENQVVTKGSYKAACLRNADTYCTIPANAGKPECVCINFNKTTEFDDYVKAFPQINDQASYQCWGKPCAGANLWGEVMTSNQKDCPDKLQICAQAITTGDIHTTSLGAIQAKCSQSASDSGDTKTSDTTNNTTNNNTVEAAKKDEPAVTTPPPNTSSNTNIAIGFCIFFTFLMMFGGMMMMMM